MLRALAGRAALAAASTMAALLLGEALVRVVAPQNLIALHPGLYVPDPDVGWHLAPSVSTVINTGEGAVRMVTDARGHRIDASPPGGDSCCRVLAIGDSFVEALQVEHEDTLTARLQAALTEGLGCRVDVTDAAAAGWGPSHYRLELLRELEASPIDLVVVFLYAGNDVEAARLEAIPPRETRAGRRLRIPRGLRSREIVDAVLYPVNDVLEARSHLFQLLKKRGALLLMRVGLSARYFPEILLRREAGAPRWSVTADLCGEMAAACGARGIPCLFVLLPGVYQVEPELATDYASALGIAPEEIDLDQPSALLGRELGLRGIPLRDVLPGMRGRAATGARLYGEVDTHLSTEGHRAVAEMVLDDVRQALAGRCPGPDGSVRTAAPRDP